MSTGNQFTVITLNEHPITLVTGNSGDGKTTMMDALSFVWFGKALRPINKPILVNTINGKDCEVYVIFKKFRHIYKITRGIKPNTLDIDCDGEPLNMPAGKEPQEMIDELLGFTHKVMKHVVLLSNASYVPFMRMNAKERREIVEELRELYVFSEMAKLAKDEVDIVKKSISDTQNKIALEEKQKVLLEGFIRESSKTHTDRIQSLQAELDNHAMDVQHLREQRCEIIAKGKAKKPEMEGYEEVKTKLSELKTKKIKLTERNRTLKSSSSIETLEKCPTCFQLVGDDHKHDIAEKAKAAIDGNLVTIGEIDHFISECETNILLYKEVEKELDNLRQQVSTIDTKLSMKKSTMESNTREIEKLSVPQEGTERYLGQLKEAESNLGQLEPKIEAYKLDLLILQECQKHLKDDGIKASLVEEFIPTFNALANKYLDRMDFFVQFELDKDFNETIKSRHRDEFTYYSFSEGEKQRIDLALLFAWRELSKMSGLVLPNVLFLDEVFDSSLDPGTADRVIEILTEIGDHTNVVCISHTTDLPPVFSRIVKFSKQKNYSIMSDVVE